MVKGLTQKQTLTLKLMSSGYTDFDIAEQRQITRKTVSAVISTIIHKLGAANRPHAVLLAARRGLIYIPKRHRCTHPDHMQPVYYQSTHGGEIKRL